MLCIICMCDSSIGCCECMSVVVIYGVFCCFFFFKQKTAYEMRISDWSSDVCSSDLPFTDIIRKRIGRDESEERTLGFSLSSRTPFKELTVQAAVPGEERWWSISGQPISNEFGNFQGFRGSEIGRAHV